MSNDEKPAPKLPKAPHEASVDSSHLHESDEKFLDEMVTEEREQEGPPDPSTDEPPPPKVAELCAAGLRFVQQKYGVPLDFTSDTLSLVDHYIREARAEIIALPSSLDLVSSSVGAYFGEVVRKTYGGYWIGDAEPHLFRLALSKVHLSCNPVGIVREALLRETEEGWSSHLAIAEIDRAYVAERMDALSDVDEEEYYLPSTRFDAIALAFDALRAKMISRGEGSRRFFPKDYGS